MQSLEQHSFYSARVGVPLRHAHRVAGCVCRSVAFLVMLITAPCVPNIAHADGVARSAAFKALVDRQVRAWTKGDFSIGADDWAADGELRSPGGRAPKSALQATMTDYRKNFKDLDVVVTQLFVSANGRNAAVEWDWSVTRIKDGKRGKTHDAIIVDLERGKIKSWREYFDFGNSVDANP